MQLIILFTNYMSFNKAVNSIRFKMLDFVITFGGRVFSINNQATFPWIPTVIKYFLIISVIDPPGILFRAGLDGTLFAITAPSSKTPANYPDFSATHLI